MRIMVIGSGGREHALAWKISRSSIVDRIFCIPGNAGMSLIADCVDMGIKKDDFPKLANFAKKNRVDLTVVGPEAPLVEGISDFFNGEGLNVFGPGSRGAMLEGSKVFTRRLLSKYGIPIADGLVFERDRLEEALGYLQSIREYPVVVKADGLAAGKGVIIAGDIKEAISAVEDCFVRRIFGNAGDSIIIEEFLEGFEVSILCLYDGDTIIPMALAQDYKRIFDGDEGKNTGGMGSYSPVPEVPADIYRAALKDIIYPTARALAQEGIKYRGILYAGILISNGKPFLLEYNCRFGDPETQAVLPRLKEDIVPLLIRCSEGNLPGRELQWHGDRCVCVVMASKGYPESSSKGDVIEGLGSFSMQEDLMIFHAGTKKVAGNIVTNGGRVLGVAGLDSSFNRAREKVYSAVERIRFSGMQYRKDIAMKAGKAEEVYQ
ncbi:MAG: phosphoribosylamine--glycine ligase [Actinobacteria bacterium]|nr:phosphoribosylamine--glycine ligase [Actinomycetota bacterium]